MLKSSLSVKKLKKAAVQLYVALTATSTFNKPGHLIRATATCIHTISEVVQCCSTFSQDTVLAVWRSLKKAATRTAHRPYDWTATKRHGTSHGVEVVVVVNEHEHLTSGHRQTTRLLAAVRHRSPDTDTRRQQRTVPRSLSLSSIKPSDGHRQRQTTTTSGSHTSPLPNKILTSQKSVDAPSMSTSRLLQAECT